MAPPARRSLPLPCTTPPLREEPGAAWPRLRPLHAGLLRRLCAVGLLLLCAGWGGPVLADRIEIESPAFSVDSETNRYRYEGARVTLGALSLQADVVEIDAESTTIVATGRVRFEDGPVTGSADRLELVTATGVATLYNAEVYEAESGYFLSAEKLVRTGPNTYEGEDCRLTNCRPGEAGWHITSSGIDYETDNYALSYNSVLWLGSAPVLWSPVLGWPTVEERRSGLLAPTLNQNTSTKPRFQVGTSVSVPYFWAIGLDQDLTFSPEYFSERGTGLGLEYNYAFMEHQKGQLKAFGIEEQQHRNLNRENRIEGVNPSEEDNTPSRFWTRYGHNQAFTERTQLVIRSAQTSDGQVLREYEGIREYRPRLEYQASVSNQSTWLNSALTAAHTSEYLEESLFSNSDAETDGVIRPQLLPRAAFNTGWQPTRAVPLGLDLDGALTRFVTTEGVSGQAAVATPSVAWPVPLFGSAEFRPTLGRRFVRYSALDVAGNVYDEPAEDRYDWLQDAESLQSVESYGQNEAELELRLPVARRFDLAEGNWGALKHRMTPRLIYHELEDVAQSLEGLLLVPEPALKLATFRLDNALLGLHRGSSSGLGSTIADLNLIQRYDLLQENASFDPVGPPLPSPGETDPGEPLLPLIVEGDYFGAGYSLDALLRYHHQLERIVEYRIGLNGSLAERGRFGVAYSENQFTYRTPENRLYTAGSALSFNGLVIGTDTVSANFGGSVNLGKQPAPLNRRLQRAEVGVNYHPNCYGVALSYVETVDVTQEYNSESGENEDSFFIDRKLLLTFNLGGVISSTRTYGLSGE